jgi:DNA polymerase III subunit delta
MAAWKPAYLIHGDAHGRIAERRARLRTMAEAESGVEAVEVLEGDAATPEAVGGALNAMTFAVGRRFIIVDGVERWKDADVEAHLAPGLKDVPPETTVAFFAREDGRVKTPASLVALVKKIGDIAVEATPKAKDLPQWAMAEAQRLGVTLERPAAQALVTSVGERQQRLLRELEKLALGAEGDGSALDAERVTALTASSSERRAWSVADAVVAGDQRAAIRAFLELRQQGERVPGLLYWISQRVRQAHEVATALDAGEAPAQVKRRLRMPSRAADALIADAGRRGAERLREAVCEIADLELASRGGSGGGSEDTAALLTLRRLAG